MGDCWQKSNRNHDIRVMMIGDRLLYWPTIPCSSQPCIPCSRKSSKQAQQYSNTQSPGSRRSVHITRQANTSSICRTQYRAAGRRRGPEGVTPVTHGSVGHLLVLLLRP